MRDANLTEAGCADAAACRTDSSRDRAASLRLVLHLDMVEVENEWRGFEQGADRTPFQSFDWLAAWQRCIGTPQATQPIIATAFFAEGDIAFILPMAIERRRFARRLCWLGQELNDYNAPILARDFPTRVASGVFLEAWCKLQSRLQANAALRPDWIELEKMPQTVGGQSNPFWQLPVTVNPSGAHSMHLGRDWEQFYVEKRSSGTRRRDRSKRKKLAAYGGIGFVDCAEEGQIRQTLDILMQQKARHFARRGIADIFARPGWRQFFVDVATGATSREFVHVSRLQIGEICAAANLGLVLGATYYHVLASYDDGELARYGPGALHLRELVAYAIRRGLRKFDFTIGDEAYKLEWSDAHLRLADHSIPVRLHGLPAWSWSALRRPLKRFLKQTPLLWHMVSGLRAFAAPFVRRRQP